MWEVAFKWRTGWWDGLSCVKFWESGRRNSKCKGLGARTNLAWLRNIKDSACQRKQWRECSKPGGLTWWAYREARYKRNMVLHFCPMCVAVGFLFYDLTVFIYLELGRTSFPIFTLFTSIEMSHYPIGTPVLPFTGCQHRLSLSHQSNFKRYSLRMNPSVKFALT